MNEKNGMWRGDNAALNTIHAWVKRRIQKPPNCERCGKPYKRLDLANISQKYMRRLDDWEWLCRSCHMLDDGRMDNLLIGHNGRGKKPCKRCNQLTTNSKWCPECGKIVRREWWRKYNKSPLRAKYRKERAKRIRKEMQA